MGYKVANVMGKIDYSQNVYSFIVDREVVVDKKSYKKISKLLETGDLQEAKKELLEIAPKNAKSIITAAFKDLITQGKMALVTHEIQKRETSM